MHSCLPFTARLGIAAALPLLVASQPAFAQDAAPQGAMSPQDVQALPPEYRSGPIPAGADPATERTERTIGEDGVETITRTRRIESRTPAAPAYVAGYPGTEAATYPGAAYPAGTYPAPAYGSPAYAPSYAGYAPYAPAPRVFEREQWIEECRRRTAGRDEDAKGGIIGALLGAIAGGIIGNQVAGGERLAGTLIGAGTGGLLGNLIGRSKKKDGYDCEAALDGYLSQHGTRITGQPPRIASRSIPATGPASGPAPVQPVYPQAPYAPAYAPAYVDAYTLAYGYGYAPPPQMTMIPVRYAQPQRVIVRETVREESIPAARTIPEPVPMPSPKMIMGD